MFTKPILYDVCCSAGGCTRGYQNAGFYVIGVDIDPQPHYVGDEFIQMDGIEFLVRYLAGEYPEAAAFSASPPCQEWTKSAKQWRAAGKKYPDLIADMRNLLKQTGKPFVIENVPGAPLINPIMLNADMFGINIARVRLFECSFETPFFLIPPPRKAVKMGRPIKDGDIVQPVGHFSGVDYVRKEMGCEWMNQHELAQAIPPAFTRLIGGWLMQHISGATADMSLSLEVA